MTEDERFERILATRERTTWPESVIVTNPSYASHWPTSNKMTKWMEEHIGQKGRDWSVSYRNTGIQYQFKDPSHKILFALTWL